jgi:PTH1 family peptidyl-tRNA hydrolase
MIRLFVGLGNPGTEYEATRHNAGFWWVDALASQWGARLAPDRAYQGLVVRVARPPVGDGPVWLLEPMTYMNRSGVSVAGLARFFKIAPEEILVVHDELDLLPGQVKLKQGGSAAGHNGLAGCIPGNVDHWDGDDTLRARCGSLKGGRLCSQSQGQAGEGDDGQGAKERA